MTEPRSVEVIRSCSSAHLGLQRRLVADRRGHAPEQGRDLGARLDEAEDVVDEEQHVLAALLAEVFGHRQPREGDAEAGAGGLVHLAEDEHRLVDDAGLLHLEPEVVALARALADAAEGREAFVLLADRADQLLDQHGLADAGAAEEPDLAALGVGREQVDHLDPGLEDLLGRSEVGGFGRRAVDRPALLGLHRLAEVDRLAEQVEDAAQGRVADRNRDRPAGVDHLVAALQAVGGVHRHRAHPVVAEVLLHLADQLGRLAVLVAGHLDLHRRVDLGQLVGEDRVDDHAGDLLDASYVCSVALSHWFLFFVSKSYPSASAPATTSRISWVISACRTRFISRVRSPIISSAFSAALRIAVIRAPSSEAADSSSAR